MASSQITLHKFWTSLMNPMSHHRTNLLSPPLHLPRICNHWWCPQSPLIYLRLWPHVQSEPIADNLSLAHDFALLSQEKLELQFSCSMNSFMGVSLASASLLLSWIFLTSIQNKVHIWQALQLATSCVNPHFILHDSKGFEAGSRLQGQWVPLKGSCQEATRTPTSHAEFMPYSEPNLKQYFNDQRSLLFVSTNRFCIKAPDLI